MLRAKRYEILRGLTANGRIGVPLPEKPIRVATLLDEAVFVNTRILAHHETVFFEDRIHDWDWNNGMFRYYSRVADVADVVVVYEEDDLPSKSSQMEHE